MKDSEIASAAYTIPEAPSGTITINPAEYTAYTGGDSMGDTSFPLSPVIRSPLVKVSTWPM